MSLSPAYTLMSWCHDTKHKGGKIFENYIGEHGGRNQEEENQE
jgi:hypothetical protein